MVSVQPATASTAAAAVAARAVRSAPERQRTRRGARRRGSARRSRAGGRTRCRARGAAASARSSGGAELVPRCCATWASPKRSSARVGGAHVAVAEAVGDDRAAADDRLEHGQPGARVDQRVAGREHVAHPVGEAHQPQPRLVAELRLATRARSLSLRPHRQSTIASGHGQRGAGGARAGRRRPSRRRRRAITLPSAGSAERPAGVGAGAGGEEGGRGRRLGPADAVRDRRSARPPRPTRDG